MKHDLDLLPGDHHQHQEQALPPPTDLSMHQHRDIDRIVIPPHQYKVGTTPPTIIYLYCILQEILIE